MSDKMPAKIRRYLTQNTQSVISPEHKVRTEHYRTVFNPNSS